MKKDTPQEFKKKIKVKYKKDEQKYPILKKEWKKFSSGLLKKYEVGSTLWNQKMQKYSMQLFQDYPELEFTYEVDGEKIPILLLINKGTISGKGIILTPAACEVNRQ